MWKRLRGVRLAHTSPAQHPVHLISKLLQRLYFRFTYLLRSQNLDLIPPSRVQGWEGGSARSNNALSLGMGWGKFHFLHASGSN